MNNKSGNFFVWLLTLPLLAYSMFRNLDLIVSTMGNDPGAIVAGVGALFALDLGVLFWLAAFNGARGTQRSISGILIVVDLLGAFAGLLADTLLKGGGGDNADLIRVISQWAIPIVIGVNFAAGITYHAADPDKIIRDRQRALDDELRLKLADALAANSGAVVETALPVALSNLQAEAKAHFLAQHAGGGVPAPTALPAIDYAALAAAIMAAGGGVPALQEAEPIAANGTARKNGHAPKA